MERKIRIYALIPWSSQMNEEYTKVFFDSFSRACKESPYEVVPIWGINKEDKDNLPPAMGEGKIVTLNYPVPSRLEHFGWFVMDCFTGGIGSDEDWMTFLDADDYVDPKYFTDPMFESESLQVILANIRKVDRETGRITIVDYLQNRPHRGEMEKGGWGLVLWGKFFKMNYVCDVFEQYQTRFGLTLRYPTFCTGEYLLISMLYSGVRDFFRRSINFRASEVETSPIAYYYWFRNPSSLTNNIQILDMISAISETDSYLKEAVVCSFGAILISKTPVEELRERVLEYVDMVKEIWPEWTSCDFRYETSGYSIGYSKKSYIAKAFLDPENLPEMSHSEWRDEDTIMEIGTFKDGLPWIE